MRDLAEQLRWASKMCTSQQEYEMTIMRGAAEHIDSLEYEIERLEEKQGSLRYTIEKLIEANKKMSSRVGELENLLMEGIESVATHHDSPLSEDTRLDWIRSARAAIVRGVSHDG